MNDHEGCLGWIAFEGYYSTSSLVGLCYYIIGEEVADSLESEECLLRKQPAERSQQKHRRCSLSRKASEASFDTILRQAALSAVHTFTPGRVLNQHQAGIFQQMNQAMLYAHLQQYETPPTPDEIQHMRDLIRTLWQELIGQEAHENKS